MNFNDKFSIEVFKCFVMCLNYPFYIKQDIIREIDKLSLINDSMRQNDYYRNFIWYSVKELFIRAGIIPGYY
ncbi:MAG: hypothetical protein IKP77_02500 [Acholeplasmatales bacterium]|nr:hypothetical protein [Acholeplasmatales bacterium]